MNSRSSKPNFFGITPPVSTRQPEPLEIAATEKLIETLTDYDQYEAPEEAQKRH
jgi:poly(A) polymerase Pap1